MLPCVARDALTGIGPSDAGELTLEGGGEREAVQPLRLGGYGGERGVVGRGCAVHHEAGARQGLERRRDIAISVEVVRPCRAAAQGQDRVLHRE